MMIYFEVLDAVECLTDRERGQLFLAMLKYGQEGQVPEFTGKPLAMAWRFVKPRLDRDKQEYIQSVRRRQYAVACRERKRKGEPEIRFEDWLVEKEKQDRSPVINDDQWHPTTTTSTSTNTTTTASTAAAATTSDFPAAAAAQREMKKMGGQLGKGVVLLNDDQVEDLLDQLGLDAFDYYVDKLSDFILKHDARVINHYDTILKWWRRDSGLEERRR